jgi:diacylglycerol diphosphate phosphatase / phosphatidate phosphatase
VTILFNSVLTVDWLGKVFLKWLIGGLRPHFYAACKPNIKASSVPSGVGFGSLMYDRSICTGDEKQINDSLESFPSGHSTAAFAGLIYLALYLNAQLKVMSAHNPAYWKTVLFFAPILGATLIAGALTIDECELTTLSLFLVDEK